MDPGDRLQRALQKIVQARASIVKTAAQWQAQGIETSPLTDPTVEIQEALTQLEILAASLQADSAVTQAVTPAVTQAAGPGVTPAARAAAPFVGAAGRAAEVPPGEPLSDVKVLSIHKK